jgi:hypothetical protein
MSEKKNLEIQGYEHPNNLNYSGNKKYKIFNSESEYKKNNYVTSKNWEEYSTFNGEEYNYNTTLEKSNSCPKCKNEALYSCNCNYKDKQCSKGHVWYINNNNEIQLGDPHN